MSPFTTKGGQIVTIYQIGEQFSNAYKRAATGKTAAKGFQASFLVTITSSDHMISL
jgi:hypothetical protein